MAEMIEQAICTSPSERAILGCLAFAFPGVGVGLCGHEEAFWRRHHSIMAPRLEEASDAAGGDLTSALSRDGAARLSERASQLFAYAYNCAVAEVYLSMGLRPEVMAGHSMGIYSALAMAGTISYSAGLAIVERAFEAVAAACPEGVGGMAVVVGLDQHEIDGLLAEPGWTSVRMVNSNNDTTKIFAGRHDDLDAFCRAAAAHDALKARLLPVSSPYHHPELLNGASAELERFLRRFTWRRAACPIISSIDQRLLSDGEDLLDLTARNITTPIDWELVMHTLVDQGVSTVVECGAGLSLSGNGRLMPISPAFITVKNARRRLGL
jgi:[acyl-carrier-protein] S-malonyltransferase